MHEPSRILDDGRDRKRRGATARGVDSQKTVLRVLRGVARAVDDGRRRARHHAFNITSGKRFFGTVRRDAQRLAQPAHAQLSEQDDGWAMTAERTAWRDPLRTRTKRRVRTRGGVGAPMRGSPARSLRTTSTWSERGGAGELLHWPHSWASRTHLGAGQPSGHAGQLVTAPANRGVVVTR